ncbi:MAG: hypothetical protein LUD72_00380 [Bacteroidales bacterium]|nr:hypothetical protein [Bacteroidales bacterium]
MSDLGNSVYSTQMWNETNSQNDGTLLRDVHFPTSMRETIYSGPHIGIANPLYKTSREVCIKNSDYDNISLMNASDSYIQRVNYSIKCDISTYSEREPMVPWDDRYSNNFRLCLRFMLNQSGERTLIGAVIPPMAEHINGLFGVCLKSNLISFATSCFSLPFDFLLKVTRKDNLTFSVLSSFPVIGENPYQNSAICRALLLNCLTSYYAPLWKDEYKEIFSKESWSKDDTRLNNSRFTNLKSEWDRGTPLRSDYERRQALVEIDVLTSMSLGMSIDQLKTIYTLSFSVLQKYENDTWYDTNGQIVFTNNASYNNVGFKRSEWEEIKNAEPGEKFYRTITDDTMPGGPVQRTIEYVAPFDRCDRVKDYETAWAFFEHKYGKR